jgi:hypothetical protein
LRPRQSRSRSIVLPPPSRRAAGIRIARGAGLLGAGMAWRWRDADLRIVARSISFTTRVVCWVSRDCSIGCRHGAR